MKGEPLTEADPEFAMFGKLIRAAFGLDMDWMEHGRCRSWRTELGDVKKSPWLETAKKPRDESGVSGAEIIKAALMICSSCPVQHDCASYALEGLITAGTWSMDIGDLRWLQKQPDGQSILDLAHVQNRPVQDVVVQVRTIRAA